MSDFSVYGGKGLNQDAYLSREEIFNFDGSVDRLQTLFDKAELDVNLSDGVDANEAKVILGLFDTDGNNDVTCDELRSDKYKDFFAENVGTKYSNDNKYMLHLEGLAVDVANRFWMAKDLELSPTAKDHTVKNSNNVVIGGYVLDTVDGVTTKTRFAEVPVEGTNYIGGRTMDELSESWKEGFKDYKKTWKAPDGKTTTLTATNVVDNKDGTFNVTVRRTGIGASNNLVTLVLDSDGNEIDRFDEVGNKYDSTGVLTKKSFTTKDADGKITGGYELDLTGGKTKKIRYNTSGSVDESTQEEWSAGFKDYKKTWTSPDGKLTTTLVGKNVIDNKDGTFSVSTVRDGDDSQPVTLLLDENGNEISRFELKLTDDKTEKIRKNADGSKNESIEESWGNKYKDYKKTWTGPNGETTTLKATDVADNGDGTFKVTVKKTDSRLAGEQTFILILDAYGNELSRIDELGNKYDSIGNSIEEAEEEGDK